ncbi:MAG: hypothetical protein Q9216_004843, partial [Gyalolechia sp. 2 TL-2023]
MPPKPDLASHTLIHFLDRFVYRNPKTTTTARGASIMQPLSSSSGFGTTHSNNGALLSSAPSFKDRIKQPVNSEAFWKMEKDKVAADEVFFHKYFSAVGKGREKARGKKERRKRGKGLDEEGSEEDGEEEAEIWKALVESRPEIEGDEEGRSEDDVGFEDEDMDELDEEDMGSDEGSEREEEIPPRHRDVPPEWDEDDDDDDNDEAMPDLGEDDDALLGSDDDVPKHPDTALLNESKAAAVEARGDDKGKKK